MRIKDFLRPKPYSLFSAFILILLITILTSLLNSVINLQETLFLLYGLPVFYIVFNYSVKHGLVLSFVSLVLHLMARWPHFSEEINNGIYSGFLLKGIIGVGLYLVVCTILGHLIKKETIITEQYKKLAEELAHTMEELKIANTNVRSLYLSTIKALAAAIEAKDKYTRGHSDRVTQYALDICVELGLDEQQMQEIMYASVLHDIGKIGVSEDILGKKGKLEPEEYEKIKKHTTIGANIISSISMLESIIPIIVHHHESYDGKGYPYRKKEEEIPLGSRIIAVADSYDAMTSDRPYRKAMSKEEAVAELRRCAGTQFDPEIVEAFIKTLEAKEKQEAHFYELQEKRAEII
jgi:putative nucleotidyltransferase with HDIG domain